MKKTSKLFRKVTAAKSCKRMTPYKRLQAAKKREEKEEEQRQAEYYKAIRFTPPMPKPEADDLLVTDEFI
jgi:hypothetical protein